MAHRSIMATVRAWAFVCLGLGAVQAEDAPQSSTQSISQQYQLFEAKVRPVLVTRCIKCHGSEKQESGLRLDSLDGMLADSSANGLDLVTTQSQQAVPPDPKTAALIDLCHVLLNSSEFLYVD